MLLLEAQKPPVRLSSTHFVNQHLNVYFDMLKQLEDESCKEDGALAQVLERSVPGSLFPAGGIATRQCLIERKYIMAAWTRASVAAVHAISRRRSLHSAPRSEWH